MERHGEAQLLRIFVAESDKVHHAALYEVIVREAMKAGLAGATVLRGVLGFGATSHLRSDKVLDLSSDLPLVVEIVDAVERIEAFLPTLHTLFELSRSGGLITLEKVRIIQHTREQ